MVLMFRSVKTRMAPWRAGRPVQVMVDPKGAPVRA